MCGTFSVGCWVKEAITEVVSAVAGSVLESVAEAVAKAVGNTLAALGTIWTKVPTLNLVGGDPNSTASAAPPDGTAAGAITTFMGYVTWIALAVAIMSLIAFGGMIAIKLRAGEGIAAIGKIGMVLGGVVLISGSGSIVAALLPAGPRGLKSGSATEFLQSQLWWYMGAAAVVSVIIGAARMAWEQRADPGKETLKSLLTLVVVAGAGVWVVGLLTSAADSFSTSIINASLSCDATTGNCFAENIVGIGALTAASGPLGYMLIILLGLIAILSSIIQIILMVARSGMLVVLCGILPLAAAATNTEMGKSWFKKCVSWLVAFILYKPAAAIIYATAFKLVGQNVFTGDSQKLLSVVTGVMMMILALFAMPALMRFVTPMVGALAAGGASGAIAASMLVSGLPTGAAEISKHAGNSGGGGGGGGDSSGPKGSSAGSEGGSTTGQPGGSSSSGQPMGGQMPGADAASQSGAGGGTGKVAASTGGGGAAGGGAAGGGAAGGGAAGGAAAGGAAAAGPVGVAAVAAKKGADAAKGAVKTAQTFGDHVTGESTAGEGPSGNG
jgi:hypothetical protein